MCGCPATTILSPVRSCAPRRASCISNHPATASTLSPPASSQRTCSTPPTNSRPCDEPLARGVFRAAQSHPRRLGTANRGLPADAGCRRSARSHAQGAAKLPHHDGPWRRSSQQVTGELLVQWFGRQTHWAPETRKGYRSSARGFFTWCSRTGRVAAYISDELPKPRPPQAVPRPAPGDALRAALAGADARTRLMLRLAAECGLRRAEVARLHTRDLIDGAGGASLLVQGKGGKRRVVPIGDDLAARLRRGRPAIRQARRRTGGCSPRAAAATSPRRRPPHPRIRGQLGQRCTTRGLLDAFPQASFCQPRLSGAPGI